jgi:hypothetical protein
VAVVGIVIRRRTDDSFVFEQHRAQSEVLESPAMQLWCEMLLFMVAGSAPETKDTSLEIEGMPAAPLIR